MKRFKGTTLNQFRFYLYSLLLVLSVNSYGLDKVTFQLDWLPGGDKAPIYVGIQSGIFEALELDVTISSGRGSTDALTKLATGRSDIGTAGLGALMTAKSKQRIPVSALMPIFTKSPHAFITSTASNIKSIQDLKGKVIATSPFTSSNVFLPAVLAKNHMSSSDFKTLFVDAGALGPLLATGKVDAVIAWLTDGFRYAEQLKKAGKDAEIIEWSESGLDLYGISLIASDKFLREKPAIAKRFVEGYLKSLAFTHQNPEIAAQYVHRMVNEISLDHAIASVTLFNTLSKNEVTEQDGLGNFSRERLQESWELVARSQGLLFESLDLDKLVANLM